MPLRGESDRLSAQPVRYGSAVHPAAGLRCLHLAVLATRSSRARYGHEARHEEAVQMRIGLIAPPWVPVPPPAYGGTEVVIDNLARGLQDLGHEVRLFTVGESECPVPIDFLYPEPQAPIGCVIQE